ncbi:MAG: hypothetical protein J4203_03675 [Candidatus Diapherotrites archaeon]|uniref:Uncharacterized protein n=1 Tax=Candidatus Iainarchaeum sp. TaxID=3101447 RepID=A0A8T4L6Q0_9ARCH|nr:hypothetical protein [Candidatus Diapherotrites archaeon]
MAEDKKQVPVDDDDEGSDEELPFPRATIVNMLRQHLDSGKQIKGQVKREMNIWLGSMVERIAHKMNAHPYTYVDGSMFRESIEPYEAIQEIEKEKERIIKQLESVKAACDVLISEVDRKFVLRSGFATEYQKEKEAAAKGKK